VVSWTTMMKNNTQSRLRGEFDFILMTCNRQVAEIVIWYALLKLNNTSSLLPLIKGTKIKKNGWLHAFMVLCGKINFKLTSQESTSTFDVKKEFDIKQITISRTTHAAYIISIKKIRRHRSTIIFCDRKVVAGSRHKQWCLRILSMFTKLHNFSSFVTITINICINNNKLKSTWCAIFQSSVDTYTLRKPD